MKKNVTTLVAERNVGFRTIAGTDFPILDRLERQAFPGRRVRWLVVVGLCNGAPSRGEIHRTLREARESYDRLTTR